MLQWVLFKNVLSLFLLQIVGVAPYILSAESEYYTATGEITITMRTPGGEYINDACSPVEYLLQSGEVIEDDNQLISAQTGDWYLPAEDRIDHMEAYATYMRQGSRSWSAAIGLYSPGYDDQEIISKRALGKHTANAGHAWLTILGPDRQEIVTEANVAEGKTLEAFKRDIDPDLLIHQRIVNRGRLFFSTSERIVDGRGNNGRLPHSIIEFFITPRMAEVLRLDIATHEWMSGKSDVFSAARFNSINFRGKNCTGYLTDLLDGVNLDLKQLMSIKSLPLMNGPILAPTIHRAGYRMANTRPGITLEKPEKPTTTVYATTFNGLEKGNIYLLDSVGSRPQRGAVRDILEGARSQGVVQFDSRGSLTTHLSSGPQEVNNHYASLLPTATLPEEAITHIAELLKLDPYDMQVTQKYSEGNNGSTFALGEDLTVKIFEPGLSTKTPQDFLRSAAIQQILNDYEPNLAPRLYTPHESTATHDLKLAGVGKLFMVMEKSGIVVKQPTAEHAMMLGTLLARFHGSSDALLAGLGRSAFKSTPRTGQRVDREMMQHALRVATGSANATYSHLDVVLRAMTRAPLLHQRIKHQGVPGGVLHMDFHWPNYLAGDHPHIIDFDACVLGPFVEDIANTMMHSFTLPEGTKGFSYRTDLTRAFLAGYNDVRQLTIEELKALPLAIDEQSERIVLRNNRYAARMGHWACRVMPNDQFRIAHKALKEGIPSVANIIADNTW